MKSTTLIIVALLISVSSFAQQGINYKAVLKDTNGNVLANTFMNVQLTIHQTTATGTVIYQEDHNYTTDANGLLILAIGTDNSPSAGVFEDINWSADLHFLQTTITYSGGTINFDATEFMAVPYAKHAENVNFKTVNNVTSNIPGDISADSFVFGSSQMDNDPASSEDDSRMFFNKAKSAFRAGLIQGTLGDDAQIGMYSTAFGRNNQAIGANSVALGENNNAIGLNAIAIGNSTDANGQTSIALGADTTANGFYSTAMNLSTTADALASTAIGRNNIGGGTPNDWIETDPIFEIGNSQDSGSKTNALTVLKNGIITAPSFDLSEITDTKALITKEYLDANSSTGLKKYTDNEGNTGWNLITTGQSPWIGQKAIDLSSSSTVSPRKGALGVQSFAVGKNTIASGENSVAMGEYNTSDPLSLLMVGNGIASNTNTAFKIMKTGDAVFDSKIQHTSTGNANMIPIAYGTVESNGSILTGTGNFTASVSSSVFTIDVNDVTLNSSDSVCSITPFSTAPRTSSIIISGGNLNVYIFNSSGTQVTTTFQFVIYKL